MTVITFEDLELLNFHTNKIGNTKFADTCLGCGQNFEYHSVQTFLLNRKKYPHKKDFWKTCGKCWYKSQTADSPEWRKKNSDAQLIAQNKPEQKAKNAAGVSKSWTKERRETNSQYTKDRWKNDEAFRISASKNLAWTQGDGAKFREIMKNSIGIGGLRGVHNGICYDSALELSYILWCERKSIPIKRYDLDPVSYTDELGKERNYFPDFIIYDDTIVEIKGYGLYYQKNYLRNICKLTAAKSFFSDYKMILSDDDCLKKYYNEARRLHHANRKKNTDSI